jgi:putative ribosome biogenesis GTPase RsgA
MNVEVHDTRGQERFVRNVTSNSLTQQPELPEWLVKKEIQGVILVYSIDSDRSLAELAKLLPNLPKVPAVIIGNKLDLEREVTTESATDVAKEYGYDLFELSAKSKDKVDEVFDFVLGKIVAIPLVVSPTTSSPAKASKEDLKEEGKLEKSGSCILS